MQICHVCSVKWAMWVHGNSQSRYRTEGSESIY